MKRNYRRVLIALIKTLGLFLLIGTICWIVLTVAAAAATQKMADDVWKQLGLTQKDGELNIKFSFLNGNFQYYGAKNARNVLAGDRIAVIKDLAAHAKKYSASDEFKREYEATRNRNHPAEPMLRTFNVDSFKVVEKLRLEEGMKAAEGNKNHPNPKVRNGVPYAIENMKKELAALNDTNNKKIKYYMDSYQRSNDAGLKQYNDKMKKFDAAWPADPKVMIKRRLQTMLDITADVDYSAETKQVDKFKKFVNPDYEAKPKEWKLAYRAGKPATDALRAIAQKWLQELN